MANERSISYRWARSMGAKPMGWWTPLLAALPGLYMVGLYLTGATEDAGMLGFGVAVLVVAWYLFTARGFQMLLTERNERIRRLSSPDMGAEPESRPSEPER